MSPRDERPVMSTMWADSRRWNEYVATYRPDRLGTVADLRRLLALARGRSGVILLGAVSLRHRYRDLVFAALLKLRPGRRPRVLVADATWEPGSRSLRRRTGLPQPVLGALARGAIRAIDGPHVHYGVLSTDELETFPRTWGVDPDRVVFTPFPATIDAATPTRDDGHLFSGGNSLRDYDLLEEAIAGLDVDARVAARWAPRGDGRRIASGPVPHADFVDLMASARAVVVPLQPSVRSAGQQSYLNAMLLGKPVIVTDAPGVRDYVEDGVTGLVVPPEPEALRAAIARVMDPANADLRAGLGARARAHVLARHRQPDYQDHVLLDAIGVPPAAGQDRAPTRAETSRAACASTSLPDLSRSR